MATKLGWLLLVAAVCSTSGQTTDVSTKPSKSALAAAQSLEKRIRLPETYVNANLCEYHKLAQGGSTRFTYYWYATLSKVEPRAMQICSSCTPGHSAPQKATTTNVGSALLGLETGRSKVAHGRDGDHTPFDFLLFDWLHGSDASQGRMRKTKGVRQDKTELGANGLHSTV